MSCSHKDDTPFEPEDPAEPSATNVKRKYYLYLTSNIEGACSFSRASGEKVEEGSYQYVTAYPNFDYQFVGWKINGVTVSTDQSYWFTMPSNPPHSISAAGYFLNIGIYAGTR